MRTKLKDRFHALFNCTTNESYRIYWPCGKVKKVKKSGFQLFIYLPTNYDLRRQLVIIALLSRLSSFKLQQYGVHEINLDWRLNFEKKRI